jgi:hypothetical protein
LGIKEKVQASNLIDDIQELLSEKNRSKEEAAKIFEDMSDQLSFYLNFTDGITDVQKWIEENRIIYGRKFSYEDAQIDMMIGEKDKKLEKAPRPYLKQYINDNVKDKSCIKARQSEFTESEVNENIYLCASRPFTNVRHIFPTSGMAQRMSREKISPAIEKSPKIVDQVIKPFNLTSKGFKNGSFYTVDSSWTDYQGRGPSSDKLTFDEYESQNPQIEEIFSESTSHSEIGRKVRISTPKFPGSGIDAMFLRGCQFEWYITCPKCKKEQIMTFPDNIMNYYDINTPEDIGTETYNKKLNKVYIGCKHCGTYIDKVSKHYLTNSRWIAKKDSLIPVRTSYRVTYFMLPWKTGKEILFKYHTFRFVNQFYNEVLGMGYITKEAEISREIFEQCIDLSFSNIYQKIGNLRNVSVGVDWGLVSWVVVRASSFLDKKKSKIIYIEKIDNLSLKKYGYFGRQEDHAKRVADIVEFFNARMCVNDANGIGVDRNSYLIRRFPHKAYGCFYDTQDNQRQKRNLKLIIPKWNESSRTVTISRLGSFKELLQDYGEGRVEIPKIDPIVEEFIKHHTNLVIEKFEDEKTGGIYEVVGKTGQDHLAHSDIYSKIGFDRLINTVSDSVVGIIDTPKNSINSTDDLLEELYNNEHGLM